MSKEPPKNSREKTKNLLLKLQDDICKGLENNDGKAKFTEESWLREEGKPEINKKRDNYLGLEDNEVNKKENEIIGFLKFLIPFSMFIITIFAILFSLPNSFWYECGEKYWDYDKERYVRKKC